MKKIILFLVFTSFSLSNSHACSLRFVLDFSVFENDYVPNLIKEILENKGYIFETEQNENPQYELRIKKWYKSNIVVYPDKTFSNYSSYFAQGFISENGVQITSTRVKETNEAWEGSSELSTLSAVESIPSCKRLLKISTQNTLGDKLKRRVKKMSDYIHSEFTSTGGGN
jgi:hypothetical protein